jgi:hypothetical protein
MLKKQLVIGLAVLMNIISVSIQAQKLNNVQESSVWAPKVSIDGIASEWDNKFEAYNKATDIYYTLANDDKNLYLVLQSSSKAITNKIIRGGISFTINKKKEVGTIITYPLIKRTDLRKLNEEMSDAENRHADSTIAGSIKKQLTALNEIMITGILTITDSLISIYNQYGIKASASLNNKSILTYELAVPLPLLKLIDNLEGITYNIKLNGTRVTPRQVPVSIPGASESGTVSVFKDVGRVNPENMTPQWLKWWL